jgi:hypothetical protein
MMHLNMATGAGGGKQRPPTEQQKTTPTKTAPTKKTK